MIAFCLFVTADLARWWKKMDVDAVQMCKVSIITQDSIMRPERIFTWYDAYKNTIKGLLWVPENAPKPIFGNILNILIYIQRLSGDFKFIVHVCCFLWWFILFRKKKHIYISWQSFRKSVPRLDIDEFQAALRKVRGFRTSPVSGDVIFHGSWGWWRIL